MSSRFCEYCHQPVSGDMSTHVRNCSTAAAYRANPGLFKHCPDCGVPVLKKNFGKHRDKCPQRVLVTV